MQQVLGGKGLSQGCRDGIWQQGAPWREALSRVLPSGLPEVLGPGHAADIGTCVFIPPRAAQLSYKRSSLSSWPVSWCSRSANVDALAFSVDALEPAPRYCQCSALVGWPAVTEAMEARRLPVQPTLLSLHNQWCTGAAWLHVVAGQVHMGMFCS